VSASIGDARFADRGVQDGQLLLAVVIHQQAILSGPMRWTRVALARTEKLETVLPLSVHAVCWSLSGSLALALFQVLGAKRMHSDWERLYTLAVSALWQHLPDVHPRTRNPGKDLDVFNDFQGTSFEDVAELLDRVVEHQRAVQSGESARGVSESWVEQVP
jgi:hypothetical protein